MATINSLRHSLGRDVVPEGNGWAVKKPGAPVPESRHRTQGAAEKRAKLRVRLEGDGEVRIRGRDGKIRDSDTVSEVNDPIAEVRGALRNGGSHCHAPES